MMINENDNTKLFFLIFRNKYLRFKIFQYLILYKKYSNCFISFKSIEEYENFSDKEYLRKIKYDIPKLIKLSSSSSSVLVHLKLCDNFWNHIRYEQQLTQWFIPNSVRKLEFSNSFSKLSKINLNNFIPSSITSLNIGNGFNREIKRGDLERLTSLKSIKIGKNFNRTLNLSDCFNLKKIKFEKSAHYNLPLLENSLPITLEKIVFGELFNREIQVNTLPISLVTIDLSNSEFDSSLRAFSNLINLVTLLLGPRFSRVIEPGDLPINGSLETLIFKPEYGYSTPLKIGSLPQSLTFLRIESYGRPFVVGVLPKNLETLILGNKITESYETPIGSLPSSITKLIFNQYTRFNHQFQPNSLPSSLTELTFGYYKFPIEVGVLPNSVKKLHFYNSYLYQLDLLPNSLPNNLKQLFIYTKLLKPISSGLLPHGLKILELHNDIIIEPNSLPSTLTNISFIGTFNQNIKYGIIPENVEYLIFGKYFNSIIESNSLPINLKDLSFYSNDIDLSFLENSITSPNSPLLLHLPFKYSNSIITNLPNLTIHIGQKNYYNQNYYSNSYYDIEKTTIDYSDSFNNIFNDED